jgi:hypothetical protein
MRVFGVVALGLSLSAAATAATGRPVVRVSDLTPFTVHGARFAPHVEVRVVVQTKQRRVRLLRTTAKGTFTLKLTAISAKPCTPYSVTVFVHGARRAGVKNTQQSCGPPPAP